MFPHALFWSTCKYFSDLGAISLGASVGDLLEDIKIALCLRHCWLRHSPRLAPSRAVLIFDNFFAGRTRCLYTPGGVWPGGFSDCTLTPAEGCLFLFLLLFSFEPFEFLRPSACDPWAPQGPLGTFGVIEISQIPLGLPSYLLGPLELIQFV